MESGAWARTVLQLAGAAGTPAAHADAEQQLAQALQQARQSWPGLALDLGRWAHFLAQRLAAESDPLAAVATLHVEDLYLCCGCLEGDSRALELFQTQCAPVLQRALGRLRLGAAVEQEMQQQLLVRLLVGDEQRPPLLSKYGAVGRLSTWLRVVASREGRKGLAREKRLVPATDERLERELAWEGVELPLTKESYREAFKTAFKAALAQLEPKELNLVRYRFVDGLALDQIGAIYRVHASTAHRWLDRVRQRILDLTHQQLARNLDIPRQECATIIRMLHSGFDLTLNTLFRRRDPGQEP